jgi:hypothetical protein
MTPDEAYAHLDDAIKYLPQESKDVVAIRALLAGYRGAVNAPGYILIKLDAMMDEQLEKEHAREKAGDIPMAEYSHAKYMGLFDAKCMIKDGEWHGPEPGKEKGE